MKVLQKARERLYLLKEKKHLEIWHQSLAVYTGILLVWGCYRVLLQFPAGVEETVLKGLVFGLPVLYMSLKVNKQSLADLGITNNNLFHATILGIVFGIALGLAGQVGTYLKYGELGIKTVGYDMPAIGNFIILGLFTAFWEQLVFAGFLLGRLNQVIKNEWKLVALVGALFALVHIPALVLIQQFAPGQVVVTTLLLWSLSVGSNILMLRTKNLTSPIVAHMLWGTVIFAFS